jgi:DNA-binding MarR family transcriptional regulator
MSIELSNVAESLADFLPLFNDRLASLFKPPRKKVEGLTKNQAMVIMLLRRAPGQTATELGKSLNMTNAGLTALLDYLEERRLVRRLTDSGDRRKMLLRLTERGARAASTMAREFDAVLGARIAPLSSADRRALVGHLDALRLILTKL